MIKTNYFGEKAVMEKYLILLAAVKFIKIISGRF